jgi:hypothetical protein
MKMRLPALLAAMATAAAVLPGAAHAALKVSWMAGTPSPGTPTRYDKVGVIKVGSSHARNVLVLEPGTSAGATYFVPLAKWITSTAPGWQVWSVERRENLLEDQSRLNQAKQGKLSADGLFNYYLGWLKDPSISPHFQIPAATAYPYAKRWGMNVAVGDLHRIIAKAAKLGGKVVLGGHSLGGGVVTAYASWDFGGKPGADGLAGLVYIDGGSFGSETAAAARTALQTLDKSSDSPWLSFGGIVAPFAGLFEATGAEAALIDPNGKSAGQASGLLPSDIVPPRPATNLGQYGYALNVGTSPRALAAAQGHLGKGLTASGGWDSSGALTPITRFATMFAGTGINNSDGTAAADRRPRRRCQRDGEPGAEGARHQVHARPQAAQDAAHLRLRRRARRPDGAGRDQAAGPAVRDPGQPPDARQPSRQLRPQRPQLRLSPQRLLQPPDPVSENGGAGYRLTTSGPGMARKGLEELRTQLGGDVPPAVAKLSDTQLRDLADAIHEARRRQARAFAEAGERALDRVPRLLRGPIRKIAG